MRDIVVGEFPSCNFCGGKALYDASTGGGPWAYMCEDCYNVNRASSNLGSKFIAKRSKKLSEAEKSKKARVVVATEGDLEGAAMDGVWYPECPYCGTENGCEPDGGSVCCQDCGESYRVSMPWLE